MEKGQQSPGIKARNEAQKELQDTHKEEWERLLGEARERHGLAANPREEGIKRQIAAAEKRLETLKAKLNDT